MGEATFSQQIRAREYLDAALAGPLGKSVLIGYQGAPFEPGSCCDECVSRVPDALGPQDLEVVVLVSHAAEVDT